MKTKSSMIAIYLIAGLGGLLFLGWIVSVRLADVDMPGKPLDFLGGPMTLEDMGSAARVGSSGLPVLAETMPEFEGIAEWLNSDPLTQASLRGKVVLIDFWTYSCINCIRTMPYITSWHEKYKDKSFTVIGVHTPEFDFEKKADNVRRAIGEYGITYPVPLDNDFETWINYNNRYWPAHYLFDVRGRLRYTHFGEGEYDTTERNIQLLLEEAGMEDGMPLTEMPSDVDFRKIGTPETYLGYGRMEGLGSPEALKHDEAQTYSADAVPAFNRFYFEGSWIVRDEHAEVAASPAGIVYRYRASNANLVMGGRGRAEVTLDGAPVPEGFRGADLTAEDGKTYVNVDDERLYSLIDAKGNYGEHLLRIRFLDAGVRCYAFTFG